MKKVIYPGPAVGEEAGKGAQYFPVFAVQLEPGENEVPDALAEELLARELVKLPAPSAPKRVEARRKPEPQEAKPQEAPEKEGVSRGDR